MEAKDIIELLNKKRNVSGLFWDKTDNYVYFLAQEVVELQQRMKELYLAVNSPKEETSA